MIFQTHNRTPKIKTNKMLKIMLISCWSFIGAVILFCAIATSIMSQSITPALIILIPVILIVTFLIVEIIDMNRAYVEVNEQSITTVDYYFLRRKERTILMSEVSNGEIILGYSFRVRGYRYGIMGFSYIVFKSANGKYLFKIINYPETYAYFSKLFKIQ